MITKFRLASVLVLLPLLSACGTSSMGSEAMRGVVLQYLGSDVGTVGPFYKGGKKELDVLAVAERSRAESLIDGGAALFLVYSSTLATRTRGATGADRIILVQHGKIVGDFAAQPPPAPAAAQ
ncbi:hypothetical protein [Opitutus sp. ER46]|uniref:hypothetical protein n=1 Tax=Opitutus sp. ER46 TaxID=2161864 RepID=UPI000D327B3D|nr:hypothetical protein [Opitutus sp. ER46]PTX94563.1 hypothetical protein DB354_12570 [Opitutus sp. ER46]